MHMLLVGNGSHQNRGCEAITRSTIEILKQSFPNLSLASIGFDKKSHTEPIDESLNHQLIPITRFSSSWFARHAFRMVGSQKTWFPRVKREMMQAKVVLALGGDNYSMDYGGGLNVHLAMLEYVVRHKRPFVIWGASVGPFDKQGPTREAFVLRQLQQATAIFSRESETTRYLQNKGFEQVHEVADPAFVLSAAEPVTKQFDDTHLCGAIGVNISPLILRDLSPNDQQNTLNDLAQMLKRVAQRFDRPIALIPHVTISNSNDYPLLQVLDGLLQKLHVPTILIPPTLNASELKWVIGQLGGFIGARTHATIAAMSMGIPTLSIAYSIKAIGINCSVFGDDRYVIAKTDLQSQLFEQRIVAMMSEETAIREHLTSVIPKIRTRALQAGHILKDVLGN